MRKRIMTPPRGRMIRNPYKRKMPYLLSVVSSNEMERRYDFQNDEDKGFTIIAISTDYCCNEVLIFGKPSALDLRRALLFVYKNERKRFEIEMRKEEKEA